MGGQSKILRLLDEKPIIYYAIKVYQECEFIDKIIVITQKDHFDEIERLKSEYNFDKIEKTLEGGEKRQDSVNNGILYLHTCKASDVIVIHNAVNPFVTKKTMSYGSTLTPNPSPASGRGEPAKELFLPLTFLLQFMFPLPLRGEG